MTEIRRRILMQRRGLDPQWARETSRRVIDRFVATSGIPVGFWKDKTVALYRAVPPEFDLRPLEPILKSWGARLCFPRVLNLKKGEMEFYAEPEGASVSENDWLKGSFGIEEPPRYFKRVDSGSLAVTFVPGVAFGLQGERIGMGAGLYDRYLAQAPLALKIALTFDFQLLPKLEQKPWDQPIDWIWTENRQVQVRDLPVRNLVI